MDRTRVEVILHGSPRLWTGYRLRSPLWDKISTMGKVQAGESHEARYGKRGCWLVVPS